jgi:outer membrane protein OmpA-like peptidoglycan-associated protein
MSMSDRDVSKSRWSAELAVPKSVIALALALTLAGCSSVPEYANPMNWFSDEEPSAQASPSDPGSSTNQEYPNLSTVPDRPTPSTSSDERREIRDGLIADRENARYSSSVAASSAPGTISPTGFPPTSTASPSEPALTGVPPQAATEPAASAPAAPAPTAVASTPPPQTAVEQTASARSASSDANQSTLWPNRPPPPSSIRTGTTTADVGHSTSTPHASNEDSRAALSETRGSTTARQAPQSLYDQSASPQAASTPSATTQPAQLDSASAGTPRRAPSSLPSSQGEPAAPEITTDFSALDDSTASRPGSYGGSNTGAYQAALAGYGLQPGATEFGTAAPGGSGYAPTGEAYLAGTVYFGHGSTSLSATEQAQIRTLAQEAERSGAIVRILGHASSRTADMELPLHDRVNFKVSKQRAEAIAKVMVQAGLPADRVYVEALADAAPVYYEIMPSGEAGNRRAEILFQY